ncbi:hypothetical protein A3Q56_03595 [Intoshia linei]|uniref:Uncharacterized protein n=1 Tax=Intoshia linei TaxID=1819745 RepID=A0A177B358_9BILA|nr:hypothetical protein A3Q56_03595 [Intoshia linei]
MDVIDRNEKLDDVKLAARLIFKEFQFIPPNPKVENARYSRTRTISDSSSQANENIRLKSIVEKEEKNETNGNGNKSSVERRVSFFEKTKKKLEILFKVKNSTPVSAKKIEFIPNPFNCKEPKNCCLHMDRFDYSTVKSIQKIAIKLRNVADEFNIYVMSKNLTQISESNYALIHGKMKDKNIERILGSYKDFENRMNLVLGILGKTILRSVAALFSVATSIIYNLNDKSKRIVKFVRNTKVYALQYFDKHLAEEVVQNGGWESFERIESVSAEI